MNFRYFLRCFSIVFGVIATMAVVEAQPTVSNVTVAQRAGTKLVDVYFDAHDGTPPYYTVLEASTNGGLTWDVPVHSLSGSVGTQVQPGDHQLITWDAGADWDNRTTADMVFRLRVCDSVDKLVAPQLLLQPGEFSMIPGGMFKMGRTSGDKDTAVSNAPPIDVTVSTFFMSRFEVDVDLWNGVAAWGRTGPPPADRYTDLPDAGGKGTGHPAWGMTWYDMVKWCNARSEMEKLTPVYALGGTVYRTGKLLNPPWDATANGYRLPTEAEWEKAARGGTTGKRFPLAIDTISHTQANYNSTTNFTYDVSTTRGYHPSYNTGGKPYTSPMASFAANGFGIYDLAGNVAETCWDWFDTTYYTKIGKPTVDPRGPDTFSNGAKVLRGGSWSDQAGSNRACLRDQWPVDGPLINRIGLRLAVSSAGDPPIVANDVLSPPTSVETRTALVTVIPTPAGQGWVNGLLNNGNYVIGSTATLTAVPVSGYRFANWSGDVTSTTNPLNLTVTSSVRVYANFTSSTRALLTINQPPANEGAIAGAGDYALNASATVRATPAAGYQFVHWTGDASGSSNPLTVTMTGDKIVGAVFMADQSDIDGDGLSAYDEVTRYGSDPLLPDTDRDGWMDGTEVAFGGNPTKDSVAPAFVTHFSMPTGSNNISLSFPSVPGVSQAIESSADLTHWETVESGIFGSGSVVQRSIPRGPLPNRFFRIKRDVADTFAVIPAGEFTMGDGSINSPLVAVNVDAFCLAKREVTFGQWNDVRSWGASHGYTDLPLGLGKTPEHPVYWINWYAMVKWCNALSEREGLTPCYAVAGATYRTGVNNAVVCDWNANGYRLPTEAEWEKAARGGVAGKIFPWGGDTISHAQANYLSKIDYPYDISPTRGTHPTYSVGVTPYTSPVASFAPNNYGLYDMAGNVCEWCWDWYDSASYVNHANNPRGPATGTYRVFRGGGWSSDASNARVSYRDATGVPTNGEYDNGGFRVARKSIP